LSVSKVNSIIALAFVMPGARLADQAHGVLLGPWRRAWVVRSR
jgi:hypothetical protein